MSAGMKEAFSMIPKEEMGKLREYITGQDDYRYDHQAEGTLRLDVTHSNLIQRYHDLVFHENMTIVAVKEKLYRHAGTGLANMDLYLRRGPGDTIFLYDDEKTLKSYGAMNGMEIHVKDNDPNSLSRNGGLEDVSQVEKYMMSEEDYDKRANTVRQYKREEMEKRKAERTERSSGGEGESLEPPPEEDPAEVAARFPVGSRCEVDPGARRGELAFVGKVAGMKGVWLGIRLDEPQGMNDGTRDGVSYFECPGPKYGVFARTENVRVGDYPERDPFASDDEF